MDGATEFHPALTDSGICHVHNGNTIKAVYKDTNRIKDLIDTFETRDAAEPELVKGTGQSHRKDFWIYVGDRTLKNEIPTQPRAKGSAVISINEWSTYYNVRLNSLEVLAGQHVVISLMPVAHATTPSFRELSVADRKCLYPEDTEAMNAILIQVLLTFNYDKHRG